MSHLQSPVAFDEREIAAFSFNKSWSFILEHAEDLTGLNVNRFMADEQETWLLFDFAGYEFCLYDHDAKLHVTVSDTQCPDRVLVDVVRHFSEILLTAAMP